MSDQQTPSASQEASPRGPGPWAAAAQILAVFAALQAGAAAAIFGLGLGPFYGGGVGIVTALGVATLFLWHQGSGWQQLGLTRPGDRPVFIRATLRTIAVILFGVTGVAIYMIALGAEAPDVSIILFVEGDTVQYLLMLVFVVWGTAAFGEEMFARGFMMNRLEIMFGRTRAPIQMALVAQALLFGLLHVYQGWVGAVAGGLAALFLGIAYLRTGRNLWAPIIAHGTIDTVSITLIYFGIRLPITG